MLTFCETRVSIDIKSSASLKHFYYTMYSVSSAQKQKTKTKQKNIYIKTNHIITTISKAPHE